MTPQEKLTELIASEGGAVVAVLSHDPPAMEEAVLAGALWREDEDGLYLWWCPTFPEHQGNLHAMRYDKAEVMYGRDVVFYRDGKITGTVVPTVESGMNTDDVRAHLAEWRALVGKHDNAEIFADFLANA